VPKDGSSADGLGGSQGQTWARSETLAHDKAKPSSEGGPEGATAEQNKAQGEKTETRIEVKAGSQQSSNRIVQFSKLDHPVSLGSGQKRTSRTTAPEMAPALRWCPPGLTPSHRRRIQQMRAQKMRKEAIEKERDEHFNTIWPMIPTKEEWRVKEKTSVPAFTASNDDIDPLDSNESPLIKDGSPPPIGMNINMVFTLSVKFRVIEEEILICALVPRSPCSRSPRNRANI
jgi:hypothetical protein